MIIVDSVSIDIYGKAKVILLADTKSEVPATGALTKAELTGFTSDLVPGSVVYTASCEVAILNTSDNWVWKE